MTDRIFKFLDENQPETPCLIVDLHEVENNYRRLKAALVNAKIYYAVKANPAPEILRVLKGLGARFDAASIYEIQQCLEIGIPSDEISFGNTIKKEDHIRRAFQHGIDLFAFDCEAELEKIARAAPAARVYCRFFMTGDGADWPLSEKFGCDAELVPYLLRRAREMNLNPHGVSFHVGSQQRSLSQWDIALEKCATIFEVCAAEGIDLKMVNIGGGFPSHYRKSTPSVESHCAAIMESIIKYFGNGFPEIIAEPGRYIPGDAGLIQSEVVLITKKPRMGGRRWVYLDIGRFGGLPEVLEEAIQYRIRTPYEDGEFGPVVIAGPTCDEADILYRDADYQLPLALKTGDKIEVLSAGAYTASYSAVGFNGFPPLREYFV